MVQTWNAKSYDQNARFVSDLGWPVVEWLAPTAGERILDLGCGDGMLTHRLQELGCQVMGIDASPEFINAAKALGLDVRLLDAQSLDFKGEFDAVFSNAALHWMRSPDLVIDGVWRALKPGGRFIGEMGGAGNVAAIQAAIAKAMEQRGMDASAYNPWYFPTAEDYQTRLEMRGFQVLKISLFARPTPLPTDMQGWLTTFAQPYTRELPLPERSLFIEQVVDSLRPVLCDAAGKWCADYVRLRFAASKPAH